MRIVFWIMVAVLAKPFASSSAPPPAHLSRIIPSLLISGGVRQERPANQECDDMKRYYLSSVIGSGTIGDPYRAQVSDFGQQSEVALIPTGADGKPLFPWAFCLVGRASHTPLLTDIRLGPLPDFPKDARLSALGIDARAALELALTRFSLSLDLIGASSRAWRDVIRDIGRRLEPAFHEDSFDCADQG